MKYTRQEELMERKMQSVYSDDFKDDIDVKKHILQMHSLSLGGKLSADVILSSLQNQKDQTYVIELYQVAQYCYQIVDDALRAIKGFEKVQMERQCELKPLSKYEENEMLEIQTQLVEFFLSRIELLCNLNRNQEKNWLAKWYFNAPVEEPKDDEDRTLTKEMKETFKNHEPQD